MLLRRSVLGMEPVGPSPGKNPATGDEVRALTRHDIAEIQGMGVEVLFPSLRFCTDNAAMIALAGAPRLAAGAHDGLDLNAEADLALGSPWSASA